jgi:hypothetical protein
MKPKFELGRVVSTPGVAEQVPRDQILTALHRHHSGDWGTVGAEDGRSNDQALEDGSRILSAYDTKSGHKIWIITEADRSSTCVLFPEEY